MELTFLYKIFLFILLNLNVYSDLNEYAYREFKKPEFNIELLYDNIWGTIYHAEEKQCDSSPTITGDGSKINVNNASNQRWIAISQDMLNLPKGLKYLNDTSKNIFKGKINYGDTIWIESDNNNNLNGWWVVHDTKHPRVVKSIDFLQTKGDTKLYNNNKLWSGKFLNIKIYKKSKF
jgi:hypothetical protein